MVFELVSYHLFLRGLSFFLEDFDYFRDIYENNLTSTLFAVKGLELHFLEELGEFLLGSDVVKVDGVDVFVDKFLFETELLDVPDAGFVLRDNFDVTFGPGLFVRF